LNLAVMKIISPPAGLGGAVCQTLIVRLERTFDRLRSLS
jgi:hypothetical protein